MLEVQVHSMTNRVLTNEIYSRVIESVSSLLSNNRSIASTNRRSHSNLSSAVSYIEIGQTETFTYSRGRSTDPYSDIVLEIATRWRHQPELTQHSTYPEWGKKKNL